MLNEKVNQLIQETKDEVFLLVKKLNGEKIFEHQSNQQVVSASTIKTAILLAVFDEVKKHHINLNDEILVDESIILDDSEVFEEGKTSVTLIELCTWMIINSDNTSTNVLIQKFGMTLINDYIQNVLELKLTSLQRKMLDYDAIVQGYNNYTSMEDMCALFHKLFNREILNDELCNLAISILYRQRSKNQIVRYIYETVEFAHKTGELDYWNLDTGVMKINNEYYYIGMTIHSKNQNGNFILSGKLGKLIYQSLKGANRC